MNDSKNILLTDTNNHCLKVLDLENNFVKELKLFEIKSKSNMDSKNQLNDEKFDFMSELNSIDLSPKNKLKLRLKLDLGPKIKLTKGAKHWVVFENPGLI